MDRSVLSAGKTPAIWAAVLPLLATSLLAIATPVRANSTNTLEEQSGWTSYAPTDVFESQSETTTKLYGASSLHLYSAERYSGTWVAVRKEGLSITNPKYIQFWINGADGTQLDVKVASSNGTYHPVFQDRLGLRRNPHRHDEPVRHQRRQRHHPVHQRHRLGRVRHVDRLDGLADAALARVEQGYTAVKMPGAERLRLIDTAAESMAAADRLGAVRAAVGPGVDVALDFHGRFTVAMARRTLPLLEPFLPLFVEEPAVPEADVRDVTASTTIPIALGERLYSRWDFRRVVDQGIAVVQPDVSHAGGISEVVKIAALAEAYDVALAPHCPLGPIALAASLQVGFAAPNLLVQEQGLDVHFGRASSLLSSLVDPAAFTFHEGYLTRPTQPGLGVDVDRAAVVAAAERGHRWRAPQWRRDDGSFTEW